MNDDGPPIGFAPVAMRQLADVGEARRSEQATQFGRVETVRFAVLQDVQITARPQNSQELARQRSRFGMAPERKTRDDVVEAPVGEREGFPVPGQELELPGDRSELACKFDRCEGVVHAAHITSRPAAAPSLFRHPAIATFDKQGRVPSAALELIQDVEMRLSEQGDGHLSAARRREHVRHRS